MQQELGQGAMQGVMGSRDPWEQLSALEKRASKRASSERLGPVENGSACAASEVSTSGAGESGENFQVSNGIWKVSRLGFPSFPKRCFLWLPEHIDCRLCQIQLPSCNITLVGSLVQLCQLRECRHIISISYY